MSTLEKKSFYPEGEAQKKQIHQRHRSGARWRQVFLGSTLFAIIVLGALMCNISNSIGGYVAVQYKVDEDDIILTVEESRMLAMPNTTHSEDDTELAKSVIESPYGIAFFGYAYYQENADSLNVIPIENIAPSEASAASGAYELARPLYIYTTDKKLQDNPAVAAYVNYYLTHIDETVAEVGYFPMSHQQMTENVQRWLGVMGENGATLPALDPATIAEDNTLSIDGSSTVYPLSRAMAIGLRRGGYQGALTIEQSGTTGGFAKFCKGNGTDINNASRPLRRAELEACNKAKVGTVVEFPVAVDTLAVVVNQENHFVDNLSIAELRLIFTEAETWSEVRPEWPNEPIQRFVPGGDSGTLDFFVESVFDRHLVDLSSKTLIAILERNLSPGLINRFNSELPLVERTQEELVELVITEIMDPRVVSSWDLTTSLTNKPMIEAAVAEITNAEMQWYWWLNWDFVASAQSSVPEQAGIQTAILGTLWIVFVTMVVALPIGVAAAIYLEEYAAVVKNPIMRNFNAVVQTNINNLAGVPSIIYGMLGLTVFVRVLEPLTSGTALGVADPTTANGRTILSASLTLALLIMPIIINAQEALRAVPRSLREAGMGLGATKWQTIWHHVLPTAIPGILTGNILALSRAIGETAPLIVVGAATYITFNPTDVFSKFTTLPIQIYQWTSRPQAEFQFIAAAGIIVMLIILLSLNAAAIILRNRYSRRTA